MIDATEFVSKVVTIRGVSGEEIIGTLFGLDKDNSVLHVNEPRLVVINNGEVSLLPYLLTCDVKITPINGDTVVSILETTETISKEYQNMVADENLNSPTEAELVEE
mgnify:CR=1 FL=1